MVWHNDEPLNFANSVQIFALSRLAKQRVTVVLTGEGSDELFAGYPRYRIPRLVNAYRRIPAILRRLLAAWVNDHRLEKLDRYARSSPDDVLVYNASYLRATDVRAACPGSPCRTFVIGWKACRARHRLGWTRSAACRSRTRNRSWCPS